MVQIVLIFYWPHCIAGAHPRQDVLLIIASLVLSICLRENDQGWSKFYEFSFADLRSGADIINLRTKGGSGPQWEYLHGLLENAIYGGRIDNPFDLKVCPAQCIP